MRILGLTSIVMAAGLMLASGTATATAPANTAAAVPATAAAEPAAAPADGNAAAPANTATPADPLTGLDGRPINAPVAGVGMPIPGAIELPDQVTPTGREAHFFHNVILLPLITIISLFVLALLVWVIVRYRRAANPVPSKTSHNVVIEVIWTLVPVIILVAIAIPSIRLLAHQFKPAPEGAVTLKAIGNQWFWSYEYPDHGVTFDANMLKEQGEVAAGARYRTDKDGPRLLAADNRVVLPVGVPIKLVTTANDVIHSWAMPAFWVKLDAVPGRLNETSFIIEKPGVYFGQCSELCGARHAYMPIAVEAVPPAVFEQWVRAKGGKMPAEVAAEKAAEAAAAAATANASAPANDTAGNTTEPATVNATEAAPATNQAATANPAGAGNVDH